MTPLRWVPLFVVVCVGVWAAWLAVHPALIALDANEPNLCAMTFMWPTFLPLDMTSRSPWAHKYRLMLYKDSFTDVASTQEEITRLPRGVPVLFIPGNSGSPKQVRSLSAVASRAFVHKKVEGLRMVAEVEREMEAEQLQTNAFDWFVVDFDEALSAFSGDVLWEQTEFINDCIKFILSIYEKNLPKSIQKPKSVILVGHSMGGAVARATFLASNYANGTVNTILTLSAPHTAGPLMTERAVASFYATVNSFWKERLLSNKSPHEIQNVSVLSLAGGFRDIQVAAELSNLDEIAPKTNQVSVLSTAIPHVWLSTDHLACVWCNQLMASLSRTLAALVDPRTKQATRSLQERMDVLRSIYQSNVPQVLGLGYGNSEIKRPTVPAPAHPTIPRAQEVKGGILALAEPSLSSNKAYKWNISTWRAAGMSHFIMLTSLISDEIEILACRSASGSDNARCSSLDKLLIPVPHKLVLDQRAWIAQFGRNWLGARLLMLPLNTLPEDVVSIQIRTISVKRGQMRELILFAEMSSPRSTPAPQLSILHRPIELPVVPQQHSMILNYSFPTMSKMVSSTVHVEYGRCSRSPVLTPYLLQITPWMNEERWAMDNLTLKFHSVGDEQPMNLFVFADPACEVKLSFRVSVADSLHSFLRSFGPLLIPLINFVVMAAHYVQYDEYRRSDRFPAFPRALALLVTSHATIIFGAYLFLEALFGLIQEIPIIGNHSFASLPRPWPSVLEIAGVLIAGFSAVFFCSIILAIVYFFIQLISQRVESISFMKRFSGPSPKFLIGLVLVVSIFCHSAIAIILAVIILVWPSADCKDSNVLYYRLGLALLYIAPVGIMIPSLVIWIRILHVDWIFLDSYKFHMFAIVTHIMLSRFISVPTPPKSPIPHYVSLLGPLAIIVYALYPPYKVVDVCAVSALFLIFDHLFSLWRHRAWLAAGMPVGQRAFWKEHIN